MADYDKRIQASSVWGIMKRRDQGHLYPELEVPRLTCPSRESNPGLAMGGEHSRKEPFEQLILLRFTELMNRYWYPDVKFLLELEATFPLFEVERKTINIILKIKKKNNSTGNLAVSPTGLRIRIT